MIKTYDPVTTKLMLCHLELLMIKGTSYTWSCVRLFHAHIAKQVELSSLEWSNISEMLDHASTFVTSHAKTFLTVSRFKTDSRSKAVQ